VILAIDTAGPWVSVAVGDDGKLLAARRVPARLNHNEVLASLVLAVMAEAAVERPDVVAVDVGPGSFTGTRVGVAFAAGLARGWHAPVVAVSSFEVAATLAPSTVDRVVVGLPAVGRQWSRAFLRRKDLQWQEEGLEELDVSELSDGLAGVPLIAPWGEHAAATRPPASWNPAAALLILADLASEASRIEPDALRVRYVGPSQAERRFYARKEGR